MFWRRLLADALLVRWLPRLGDRKLISKAGRTEPWSNSQFPEVRACCKSNTVILMPCGCSSCGVHKRYIYFYCVTLCCALLLQGLHTPSSRFSMLLSRGAKTTEAPVGSGAISSTSAVEGSLKRPRAAANVAISSLALSTNKCGASLLLLHTAEILHSLMPIWLRLRLADHCPRAVAEEAADAGDNEGSSSSDPLSAACDRFETWWTTSNGGDIGYEVPSLDSTLPLPSSSSSSAAAAVASSSASPPSSSSAPPPSTTSASAAAAAPPPPLLYSSLSEASPKGYLKEVFKFFVLTVGQDEDARLGVFRAACLGTLLSWAGAYIRTGREHRFHEAGPAVGVVVDLTSPSSQQPCASSNGDDSPSDSTGGAFDVAVRSAVTAVSRRPRGGKVPAHPSLLSGKSAAAAAAAAASSSTQQPKESGLLGGVIAALAGESLHHCAAAELSLNCVLEGFSHQPILLARAVSSSIAALHTAIRDACLRTASDADAVVASAARTRAVITQKHEELRRATVAAQRKLLCISSTADDDLDGNDSEQEERAASPIAPDVVPESQRRVAASTLATSVSFPISMELLRLLYSRTDASTFSQAIARIIADALAVYPVNAVQDKLSLALHEARSTGSSVEAAALVHACIAMFREGADAGNYAAANNADVESQGGGACALHRLLAALCVFLEVVFVGIADWQQQEGRASEGAAAAAVAPAVSSSSSPVASGPKSIVYSCASLVPLLRLALRPSVSLQPAVQESDVVVPVLEAVAVSSSSCSDDSTSASSPVNMSSPRRLSAPCELSLNSSAAQALFVRLAKLLALGMRASPEAADQVSSSDAAASSAPLSSAFVSHSGGGSAAAAASAPSHLHTIQRSAERSARLWAAHDTLQWCAVCDAGFACPCTDGSSDPDPAVPRDAPSIRYFNTAPLPPRTTAAATSVATAVTLPARKHFGGRRKSTFQPAPPAAAAATAAVLQKLPSKSGAFVSRQVITVVDDDDDDDVMFPSSTLHVNAVPSHVSAAAAVYETIDMSQLSDSSTPDPTAASPSSSSSVILVHSETTSSPSAAAAAAAVPREYPPSSSQSSSASLFVSAPSSASQEGLSLVCYGSNLRYVNKAPRGRVVTETVTCPSCTYDNTDKELAVVSPAGVLTKRDLKCEICDAELGWLCNSISCVSSVGIHRIDYFNEASTRVNEKMKNSEMCCSYCENVALEPNEEERGAMWAEIKSLLWGANGRKRVNQSSSAASLSQPSQGAALYQSLTSSQSSAATAAAAATAHMSRSSAAPGVPSAVVQGGLPQLPSASSVDSYTSGSLPSSGSSSYSASPFATSSAVASNPLVSSATHKPASAVAASAAAAAAPSHIGFSDISEADLAVIRELEEEDKILALHAKRDAEITLAKDREIARRLEAGEDVADLYYSQPVSSQGSSSSSSGGGGSQRRKSSAVFPLSSSSAAAPSASKAPAAASPPQSVAAASAASVASPAAMLSLSSSFLNSSSNSSSSSIALPSTSSADVPAVAASASPLATSSSSELWSTVLVDAASPRAVSPSLSSARAAAAASSRRASSSSPSSAAATAAPIRRASSTSAGVSPAPPAWAHPSSGAMALQTSTDAAGVMRWKGAYEERRL